MQCVVGCCEITVPPTCVWVGKCGHIFYPIISSHSCAKRQQLTFPYLYSPKLPYRRILRRTPAGDCAGGLPSGAHGALASSYVARQHGPRASDAERIRRPGRSGRKRPARGAECGERDAVCPTLPACVLGFPCMARLWQVPCMAVEYSSSLTTTLHVA